jgi:hypothetical protein
MKENFVKLTRVNDGNIVCVNLSNITFVSPNGSYFVIHFIGTDHTLTVVENPFPHLV